MDLQIVELIFKFGQTFALTPSSLKKPNLSKLQKLYSCFVILTYIVVTSLTYKISQMTYQGLTTVQYILALVSLIAVYTHDFYILFYVRFFRKYWYELIKGLEAVQNTQNRRKIHYFCFITSQICLLFDFFFGLVFHIYFANFQLNFLNVVNFFRRYFQIFLAVLRCIILDIILGKYKQQIRILESKIPKIQQVGTNLFILKKTVGVFNDIFGLPTFMNIFSAAISTLIALDVFIKNDGTFTYRNSAIEMLSQVYYLMGMSLYWVCNPKNQKTSEY